MKLTKKALAFLLTLCLAFSIMGVSLAEFDYSLFENNKQYEFEVKFDAMDDTGNINFPEDFKPFQNLTETEGKMVSVVFDIVALQNIATVIRNQFIVFGSWSNVKRVIFLPDKTRYTAKAISKTESQGSALFEIVTTVMTPDLMPMFEEIIEKQIKSVNYRLDSDDNDNDIDGAIIVNVEQLKTLLDLYKAAGGTKQNLSLLEIMLPVTVK